MVIGKNEQEDRDPPPPYEEDEEYDEYLFFPSISSHILFPVDVAENLAVAVQPYLPAIQQSPVSTAPSYPWTSASEVDTRTVDELEPVDCSFPPVSRSCWSCFA